MVDDFKRYKTAAKHADYMEHRRWSQEIPPIKFDSNWEIKVIPASRALVRFIVYQEGAYASVYLDGYDILARYGKPYWEVYFPERNDVKRCDMEDTDTLLKFIRESIKEQFHT